MSGFPSTDGWDPGAGWPNTLNDVVAAVRYVTKTTGISPWLLGHSRADTWHCVPL